MAQLIDMVHRYQQVSDPEAGLREADGIFRVVQPMLRLFLARKIPLEHLDDVLQKACIGAVQGLQTFKGETDNQVWSWMYQIARNRICDYFRDDKRERLSFLAPEDLSRIADASARDGPVPSEEIAGLSRAIRILEKAGAECLDLLWTRFVLGVDYATMGEPLNLNYDAVRARVRRCLERARSLAKESTSAYA
jgi:RNA polymerase sigma factor (sigma-70 family)